MKTTRFSDLDWTKKNHRGFNCECNTVDKIHHNFSFETRNALHILWYLLHQPRYVRSKTLHIIVFKFYDTASVQRETKLMKLCIMIHTQATKRNEFVTKSLYLESRPVKSQPEQFSPLVPKIHISHSILAFSCLLPSNHA
jgi:hypothetical protein